MKTPCLETERLLLRPLCTADAPHIFAAWTSDPAVARFMIWEVHKSAEDTRQWLEDVEKNLESGTAYDWGIVRKADGVLIGSGGLYYKADSDRWELGYNLMHAAWGQGYATEAARAMLDWAAQAAGVRHFLCLHAVENVRSRNVMCKLGFVYQGDGHYDSFGGTKHFDSKTYFLDVESPAAKAEAPVYFTTQRLALRNFAQKDLDALVDYRSNPICAKYQRGQFRDRENLAAFIERTRNDTLYAPGKKRLAIVLRATDEIVGDLFLEITESTISMGYTISYRFHRQGIAFELLSQLTEALHKKYPACELVGCVEPENAPSIALLQKLGFSDVGYFEKIESQVFSKYKPLANV